MTESGIAFAAMTPLSEVKAGAILGSDLCDARGMVLLSTGAVLTDSVIASLERRGVSEVPLTAPAHRLSEEQWKEAASELRSRVAHLFRNAGEGETVDRLRELVFGYRLAKLHCAKPPVEEPRQ